MNHSEDYTMLQTAEIQKPEMCLAAVKQNPMMLEFVKNQTSEICIESVRGSRHDLRYVREQKLERGKKFLVHGVLK